MEIKLLRNQRYFDINKKIQIGVKNQVVNADPDFVKILDSKVYHPVEKVMQGLVPTPTPDSSAQKEKDLTKMNWIELANKALDMKLIESVQKAQKDKLTKAQLIDIINNVNA